MDNQAQMKQELEYWDQADTQPSTSDTLPIPQQNQQSDIQPMFEIRQHATRKHSAANQHINTAPRHPAKLHQPPAPSQNSMQRRYKEANPNPNSMQRRYKEANPNQNSMQRRYKEANPNQNSMQRRYKEVNPNQNSMQRRYKEANPNPNSMQRRYKEANPNPNSMQRRYKEVNPNIPRRRYSEPHQNNRQNTAPHQNPHIRQNPHTPQAGARTQSRNSGYVIQQPPYMPQPYNSASYAPAKSSSTRQNLRAQQYTNTSKQPYIQVPIKQTRNPATHRTTNLPQNTNKNRKNPQKKATPPRGQAVRKIQRAAAPAKEKNILLQSLTVFMILVIPVAVFLWTKFAKPEPPVTAKPATGQKVTVQEDIREDTAHHPPIEENFLTISEYNRPGTKLASVKNIFVHYTANPETTAAQNRSYFENLGETHERSASAHFIIGCEGEVIQCIPLEEEAYAVIGRNNDSISIECCYINKDGSFTQATYDSLISMLAWLTKEYQLEPSDILRHYDCGGKRCPLYYVDHEDAWLKLLEDVANYSDNT